MLAIFVEHGIIETLSTTTGATTTAYRKQIFCSGHAQKLNNWLQYTVVFTLVMPHSLFWRSVDNVTVYCKVFSPFFDLPFFFLQHIIKDLSGIYCQSFFWGEILQWTSLRQKNIIIIIISIYIALNRLILHSALQCLLYD